MKAGWTDSPLRAALLKARQDLGLSLDAASRRTGVPAMVIGSYERGDRVPPAAKLTGLFDSYGLSLVPVPHGTPAALEDVAAQAVGQLRLLAAQLDRPATHLRAVAA